VRWRKIARDLWHNRARTVLVVLSIAVGEFAVGTIMTSSTVLSREMNESYREINPASVALYVDGIDQDLVDAMAHLPGVAAAEGRTRYTLRLKVGPDEWRTLAVMALADYDDTQMNMVWPEAGAWPPPKHGLLIERSGLALANAGIGSTVEVESYDGARRTMTVAGTTHDVNQFPSSLSNQLYGYVTADTLAWLGLPDLYTEVYLLAEEGRDDVSHLTQLAEEARSAGKSGHTVYGYWVPTPGSIRGRDHPAGDHAPWACSACWPWG
jgi:putative ABC transport system permease protein